MYKENQAGIIDYPNFFYYIESPPHTKQNQFQMDYGLKYEMQTLTYLEYRRTSF